MNIASIAPGLSRPLSLCAACLGLAGSACSSDDLPASKLGNTSDLLVAMEIEQSAQRVPVVSAEGGVDPFLAGDWVGHAEDLFGPSDANGQRPTYVFPSGSSDIYLHVAIGGSAYPEGTLRFGRRQAPPIPEAGVPFGDGIDYSYVLFNPGGSRLYPPIEGFTYSLSENIARLGTETDGYSAIALGYSQEQAFSGWCPLQPSVPVGDGSFNCVGAGGYGIGAGELCPVSLQDGRQQDMDCNLVALCVSSICECTNDGCVAAETPPDELWLTREGDQLIGYLSGAVFDYGEAGHFMPVGAIRFDREQP
jgi:hypothetical protein